LDLLHQYVLEVFRILMFSYNHENKTTYMGLDIKKVF